MLYYTFRTYQFVGANKNYLNSLDYKASTRIMFHIGIYVFF